MQPTEKESEKMATRNAKARKYYLSDEAITLLERESARTTYHMSTVLDMLIKAHLSAPLLNLIPAATPVVAPNAPMLPGLTPPENATTSKGFTLDDI